jgi:xanthine dehydrogenase molybdenum-binding subunit
MLDCGPINAIIIETAMGYGPYGSVGIGEDVATVAPFAFYDAVHNAIGEWVDLPATPDKVLKALGKI